MRIRPATGADATAITAIYNEGIASHRATFETELRTVEEVARRIDTALARHTWLVVENSHDGESGEIIAWAATMPYANRACYEGVAEFSIYVSGAHQGRGAGRLVLTALLAEAESAGIYKVTSRVFRHNEASRALCAAVGFREVGVHLRHGRLDGVWRDIVTVEVLLGPAA
ncbi:MAG TPA: arsinothricin resistance N-acetyltransferase ArsN1 family A [Frankiaceae bacterium]|nr:arsinothricin resistance N-acetyltransferase ArsN1 family A [Frankiaceae bacterium]